ncbi:MAG TPA: RcnB family protein [Methylovorus sp.]|jgi:Ni/Co efflux regulator RcnB|nr:RcnB family protein [Methylovorus sp.]
MQNNKIAQLVAGLCLIGGVALAAPAWAGKPEGAGHGNGNGQGQQRGGPDHGGPDRGGRDNGPGGGDREAYRGGDHGGDRDHGGVDVRIGMYFGDQQRTVVHDYYGEQFRRGNCPPGLAKKHNGCMPPGQARKWRKGYPLPRDVVYYDLPPRIIIDLGAPPAGYKYVRVAADILLIAVGTGMVVDAIDDLSRM